MNIVEVRIKFNGKGVELSHEEYTVNSDFPPNI